MTSKATTRRSAEEAYAYTPGLKVKRSMVVSKTRLLPIPGEVLVQRGEVVDFDTVVARAAVPGKPTILKASEALNILPENLPVFMVKKVGDQVKEGEVVGRYTPFFGLIKRFATSPVAGVIEAISDTTGQVVIREPPEMVEVRAYIPGEVVEILPRRGVTVETKGVFIQGIFGIGGESHGVLTMMASSPQSVLSGEMIDASHRGRILVAGSLVTLDALVKAKQHGVRGIVSGGIKGVALREWLGYEIGVAITGQENIGTSLVITEGFGKMEMSERTFELLKEFDGYEAAINGSTQIRAGVIRPEIVIPHSKPSKAVETDILARGMQPGTLVRIIREPYFGKIGTVVGLPVELEKIYTESDVRVVEVEIDMGRVIVPRANVEIIEE